MTNHVLLSAARWAALGLSMLSMAAWAHPRYDDVAIDIVTDDGTVLTQYPVPGPYARSSHRRYIEASKDERYSVRMRNRTGRRIGVVIAVDGRNIISGEKSNLKPNERMYILGPYQQYTYRGWRTGRNHVNRFYFTDVEDSYADAWGDRSAMGVIAVSSYREKRRPVKPYALRKHKRGARAGAAEDAPAPKSEFDAMEERQAGTGFGEETWSPSQVVRFKPDRRTVAKYFLKYEWRETLCRKGVIRCDRQPNRFWPQDNEGFAPYPPGWKGQG